MPLSRRTFLKVVPGCLPCLGPAGVPLASAAPAAPRSLGIVIHSYGIRSRDPAGQFADPLVFLEYCRSLGAAGIQTSLGLRDDAYLDRFRAALRASDMYVEGIVRLPRTAAETDRFTEELRCAQSAGAGVVRTVLLDGRRYESFESQDAFRAFARDCDARLQWAKPVVERLNVRLAVENHKDWRADDLLRIIRQADSPQIGICLDTGNSIALLEDPQEVVEALAPLTFTTHFKDMAVSEYAEGFLLSEVPLGTGFLDLPRVVRLLAREPRPIRLNLEMITRDPLRIPCLTPGYWTTFAELPARHLAATLDLVRKHRPAEPLPAVEGKSLAEQLALEDAHVRQSLAWAIRHL